MNEDVAASPTDVDPQRHAADEPLPVLTALARAVLLLSAEGFSVGLGLAFLTFGGALPGYMTANALAPAGRRILLLDGAGGAAALVVVALATAIALRRRAPIPRTCLRVARRLAPTAVVGFLPLLFERHAWDKLELAFLMLTLVAAVCLERGLVASLEEGPMILVSLGQRMRDRVALSVKRRPWLASVFPFLVVCLAATAFSVLVGMRSIEATSNGRQVTTLESEFLHDLLHGGSLFSSPVLRKSGPVVERHLSPFAFLLAPFHASTPRPWLLITIQSALLGFAALPLYLLCRLRLKAAPSVVLALVYLGYAPLLGAAHEGFHYVSLSGFFLLWALYALDNRQHLLAATAIALTLSVHEDAALLLAAGGAFLLVSGRRPLAATVAAVAGLAYFALAKGIILPRFGSAVGATAAARGLVPQGEPGFGNVVATILGNPWFTVSKLDEPPKLAYVLEILVPLALSPLRSSAAMPLLMPGVLFTLLYSGYPPALSIRSHFTAYWTPLVFVGTMHVLSKANARSRWALLGAILLATLASNFRDAAFVWTQSRGHAP